MPLATDELSKNAMGGTELMKYALESRLDKELLDEVQIVCSRVRELDESKVRIFWAHDLPGDPESEFLRDEGWDKFHRLVFVSNWQMQAYIQTYKIPWSKCIVLQNAITPIEEHEKPTDKIRLAYWSTPHRGLNIVVPVFNKLAEQYDNIELDVFSSFGLYGWPERDEPFKDLFQACKDHPKINYHGSVPNEQIHEYLKTAHILAYPSTWPETSCIVLMEAMSAGLLCVHPNFAALPETSANWTMMYQFDDDIQRHAQVFYNTMKACIENLNDPGVQSRLASQSSYSNVFYNWEVRARQWEVFLRSLLDEPREFPKEQFIYRPS